MAALDEAPAGIARGLRRFGPGRTGKDDDVSETTNTTETTITNDELLNATTPEALAALMARAGQEAPREGEEVGQETSAPAPAPAQPGATPGADEQNVTGIATKSGAGVLPYQVLVTTREERKQFKARAEAAEAEAERLRAQLVNQPAAGLDAEALQTAQGLNDQELADLEFFNPKAAAVVRKARAVAAAPAPAPAAAPAAAPAQADDEDADEKAAAAAAMHGRTLLLRLSSIGGPNWQQAQELDAALQLDPAWKNHADRYAEVERRVAKSMGITLSSPAASPPPPAPAPALQEPELQGLRPNTLSDLRSGASPDAADGFSDAASGMAMAQRASNMSDAQLAMLLRRATS